MKTAVSFSNTRWHSCIGEGKLSPNLCQFHRKSVGQCSLRCRVFSSRSHWLHRLVRVIFMFLSFVPFIFPNCEIFLVIVASSPATLSPMTLHSIRLWLCAWICSLARLQVYVLPCSTCDGQPGWASGALTCGWQVVLPWTSPAWTSSRAGASL